MSCEIHLSGAVEDLDQVQSFFGLTGISDKTWLNGVFMSIYNDILCMCYGSKFVILKSRYDKENQQKIFAINRKVVMDDENLIITSCMSFQVSGGSNYVDWTCIAIGLSNGRIHFYSENGWLIYERDVHNESILNLRMIGEELMVFYPSCIVVYQTPHLISMLKTLKEMLNKAKTTKIDLMDKDFMLVFKKWDYKKEKEFLISDALMVPQYKTNLFDHLLAESLELGFTKKYRLTPYQSSNVISCGAKPFLNFHSAREGFKQQGVLQDVAKAMVSKITSWLTLGSQSTATSPDELQDVSETLYPRHELIDYQRTGCNIFMSPSNCQLAAVTDTLGRIILLDIQKGIPIRMWKGYREAQCGFMDVTESRQQRKEGNEGRRSGLFLIIYAPRKAIIEIWSKGPKVATFQCSKNGFLIYNNHQNDSHHHHGHKHKNAKMQSCLFFDANDNTLKSFFIPFHCILSEANSKSAEDFHYLKRLKMALRCIDLKDEVSIQNGIMEPCEKIQTPEIKLKCLELMTNYKKVEPSILSSVIDIFKKESEEMGEESGSSEAIQDQIYRDQLSASCDNYQALINCFVLATGTRSEECLKNETIDLMENEYVTMQRIIELMGINKKSEATSSGKTVSFKDTKDFQDSIVTFLSCFVVIKKDEITLNSDHLQSAYDIIGSVLFSHIWKEILPASILQQVFELSRLKSEEIIKCFLHFFFHQEINFANEDQVLADMTKFKIILTQICIYAGDNATYAYNSICTFWQNVREYLLESDNPVNALLAAIVCKIYALQQQDIENQDEASFETVTQEKCQWVLLTEKLNDVAVLSIFVSHFGSAQMDNRYDAPNISLKKILNEGKGIISELVASWLIGVNIPIDIIYKKSSDEGIESSEEKDVIKKLEILKIHFPYSLDPPVILSHVIWKLISHWSKNLADIQYLKSSIKYLELFQDNELHLKHGLCVIMWNGNLKIPLKATQKLINKTGRLPKEKLCLQATMIPDFLMPHFLEQTLIFLDHFRKSRNHSVLEFKCEEILLQGSIEKSSVCELILQQSGANCPLLDLHFELVSVMELVAFLNIKYTKPFLSLFDETANETFFMDITSKTLSLKLQRPDEIRQNTRIFFLKKAINCAIDLIIECNNRTYFDDHLKWIDKVKILASIWNLDMSQLDRHHILELYAFNYDDLADELLEKVSERERIVKQLLDIAAKRLNLYLDKNRSSWKQVSSGGSLLTNYLETIHAKNDDALLENVKNASIDQLHVLASRIFQITSQKNFSDSRCVRLAGQLLDVSLLLKDSTS